MCSHISCSKPSINTKQCTSNAAQFIIACTTVFALMSTCYRWDKGAGALIIINPLFPFLPPPSSKTTASCTSCTYYHVVCMYNTVDFSYNLQFKNSISTRIAIICHFLIFAAKSDNLLKHCDGQPNLFRTFLLRASCRGNSNSRSRSGS